MFEAPLSVVVAYIVECQHLFGTIARVVVQYGKHKMFRFHLHGVLKTCFEHCQTQNVGCLFRQHHLVVSGCHAVEGIALSVVCRLLL